MAEVRRALSCRARRRRWWGSRSSFGHSCVAVPFFAVSMECHGRSSYAGCRRIRRRRETLRASRRRRGWPSEARAPSRWRPIDHEDLSAFAEKPICLGVRLPRLGELVVQVDHRHDVGDTVGQGDAGLFGEDGHDASLRDLRSVLAHPVDHLGRGVHRVDHRRRAPLRRIELRTDRFRPRSRPAYGGAGRPRLPTSHQGRSVSKRPSSFSRSNFRTSNFWWAMWLLHARAGADVGRLLHSVRVPHALYPNGYRDTSSLTTVGNILRYIA